mgnify:CR=1 FL=1
MLVILPWRRLHRHESYGQVLRSSANVELTSLKSSKAFPGTEDIDLDI